jgi:Glycosyltransferase family 87
MKLATYMGIAFLSAFVFWKGVLPAFKEVNSDFANYYVSARMIVEHKPLDSLYNNAWFEKQIHNRGINTLGKFSPFPPITAFVMTPLAWMSPIRAQQSFTVINLLLLFGCIWLIRKITGWDWRLSSLLILVCGIGLVNNIRFGQLYILVLFLTLLGHWQSTRNQIVSPSIITSLLSAIKYFAIIYAPAYWLVGKRRYVFATLLSLMALVILQFVFFSSTVMKDFLNTAFFPHLDGKLNGQGDFHYQFQSWDSFLQFLFIYDPQYNVHPVFSFPEGKSLIKYLITLIVIVGVFIGVKKIARSSSDQKLNWYIGLMGTGAFVLLPATATYHFVMLVFPMAMLLSISHLDYRFRNGLIILFCIIGLIPYGFSYELAKEWGVFFAFPRLWVITLLFFTVILAIMKEEVSPKNS